MAEITSIQQSLPGILEIMLNFEDVEERDGRSLSLFF